MRRIALLGWVLSGLSLMIYASAGPVLAEAPSPPCGGTEEPCAVATGRYALLLPKGSDDQEGPEGGAPAVLFLHGWGSSPRGAVGRLAGGREILSAGFALILPEGVARPGRTQRDWAVRDTASPHPRDDLAFLEAVLADAALRGVDRARVLLAGFSRGGSFVWDVACERPALFRAFASAAGAFWEPLPETCNGSAALHHSHGWTDGVVPIEGRSFREGRVVQGNVFESLALRADMMGCARLPPVREVAAPLAFRSWTGCADGARIDFVLHPGGHTVPDWWAGRVVAWFSDRLADATVEP
ncbi:MAG: alpha/beta hydrolase family esterase [Pikeienuella sp.]